MFDTMLNNDSLQIPSSDSPPISRSPTTNSFRLLLSRLSRDKRRQRHESNTTDSSSLHTVVRHTSSWKWLIVLGSFCCHFVADGVLFSFGILMYSIKDDLKLELHTVSVIASLFVSLPLFLAPITSALVNKIGCRLMTMCGGVLCTIGLVITSFAGNYLGAVIGIGVMCGMGLSCVYVPAVVIIAHYFDENRAIATGLAVGGTGLGNAVVAQLIHQLNDYYDDWRETTLFLAGVMFTIVGFGALFRPLEFSFSRKNKNYDYTMNDRRLPPSCMTSIEKLHRFIDEMDKQRAKRHNNYSTSTTGSAYEIAEGDLFDSYSADDIQEIDDKITEQINLNMMREKMKRFPPTKKQHSIKSINDNQSNKHSSHPSTGRSHSMTRSEQEKQLLEVYQQPINQKDIFYRGNVPTKTSNPLRTSCPDLIQAYVYEESATLISDEDEGEGDNNDSTDSEMSHHTRRYLFYRKSLTFLHTLRRMLGLQLFHDYRYLIFFISQLLFYLFYELIYLFPVDYGEKVIGYSKVQMTRLVTILGLGQFFGQIFFGFLANYTSIDDLILYDLGAILCGVASFLIPFVAQSYIALTLAILLFGLSISANYALTSIILANMCGLELLTSAYGLILLGQGLSSLFGPVIGGWIAEKHGYQISLIIAGVFMGLSGCVTLAIPLIEKFRGTESNPVSEKNNQMIRSATDPDSPNANNP